MRVAVKPKELRRDEIVWKNNGTRFSLRRFTAAGELRRGLERQQLEWQKYIETV